MLQLRICIVVDILVAGGERGEVGREVDQVRVLLLSASVGGSLAGQVVVIPLSTNTIIQITYNFLSDKQTNTNNKI